MVRGWSVSGWDRAERLKLRVVLERLDNSVDVLMFWRHDIVYLVSAAKDQKETRNCMAAARCGYQCGEITGVMTDDRNSTKIGSSHSLLVILMGVFCEMVARRNGA
jgi:hypothetical protein